MPRIGSIGSIASSGVAKSLSSLSVSQTGDANFRGHKVRAAQQQPASTRLQNADAQTYRHALGQHESYMREKQTFLSLRDLPSMPKAKLADQLTKESVDVAYGQIKEHGNALTDYKRFRTFKPDIGQASSQKAAAKAAAHTHPPRSSFASLPRAEQQQFKTGAQLVDISYKGVDVAPKHKQLPAGCRMLADDDLPAALAMFYDDRIGLIQTPGEAKALLVSKDDSVIIAFAGTEPGSKAETHRQRTIRADLVQRMGGFSPIYRDAAGIGRMILDHPPLKGKKVVFMGHSLGGGMAQFALGANVDRDGARISAMTYNTAGLSASTLSAIGEKRVTHAHDLVQNMRIEGDPVSPGSDRGEKVKGVVLGKMFMIDQPGAGKMSVSVHGTEAILAEIQKALD